MRILIDADGCPVIDITVSVARELCIECLILCDTCHHFDKQGAKTLYFSKGNDSVDFALVNLLKHGDVVITQDYGLAAMCLSRYARVINQNGMEYTDENIASLLNFRHEAKKIRTSGGRLRNSLRRSTEQDKRYESALRALLNA